MIPPIQTGRFRSPFDFLFRTGKKYCGFCREGL